MAAEMAHTYQYFIMYSNSLWQLSGFDTRKKSQNSDALASNSMQQMTSEIPFRSLIESAQIL